MCITCAFASNFNWFSVIFPAENEWHRQICLHDIPFPPAYRGETISCVWNWAHIQSFISQPCQKLPPLHFYSMDSSLIPLHNILSLIKQMQNYEALQHNESNYIPF